MAFQKEHRRALVVDRKSWLPGAGSHHQRTCSDIAAAFVRSCNPRVVVRKKDTNAGSRMPESPESPVHFFCSLAGVTRFGPPALAHALMVMPARAVRYDDVVR